MESCIGRSTRNRQTSHSNRHCSVQAFVSEAGNNRCSPKSPERKVLAALAAGDEALASGRTRALLRVLLGDPDLAEPRDVHEVRPRTRAGKDRCATANALFST